MIDVKIGRKLKAFTLMELMVSMLLASMAFSAICLLFIHTEKNFNAYFNRVNKHSDCFLLLQSMSTDIYSSSFYHVSSDSLIILSSDGFHSSIYIFHDNYTVRLSQRNDTFNYVIDSLTSSVNYSGLNIFMKNPPGRFYFKKQNALNRLYFNDSVKFFRNSLLDWK